MDIPAGQVIFYSCVAESKRGFDKGFDITLEYPTRNRKLTQVVTKLMERITHSEHMKILTEQQYQFFYSVKNRKCVMCVASNECKKRVAFNLIEKIHDESIHKKSALKSALNDANNLTSSDKILQAQSAVEEVKLKMIDNIDKVLDRGDNLDGLIDSTHDMALGAQVFTRSTKQLKKKMMWRALMLLGLFLCLLCVIFSVIALVLIIILCAFIPFMNGCGVFSSKDNGQTN
mmetsp:Transcript_2666/g.10248  ORF Transcript_2666/g.10248 Transcript_2666/m.10248 type:complete len:231 (+) Transcript_2666:1822-2514(+)